MKLKAGEFVAIITDIGIVDVGRVVKARKTKSAVATLRGLCIENILNEYIFPLDEGCLEMDKAQQMEDRRKYGN